MGNLLKETLFQRPSFPQSAPLGKVPLGLVEVLDFIAAWRDQTQAFRSKLPAGDRFYILDTQPAFSWLAIPVNLLDLFTTPKFAAIHAQTQSLMVADHKRLDVHNYIWNQEISYIRPVINPAPTATLFEGMKQFRDSRRR